MIAAQFVAFQAEALLSTIGRVSQVEPGDAEAEAAGVFTGNNQICAGGGSSQPSC